MNLLGRTITILVSSLVLSCVSLPAFAKKHHRHSHAPAAPVIYSKENLVALINQAIANAGSNADIGIQIKSMKTGEMLYSRNERELLVPASTMKIVTAEAALLFLGPNYKFPTRVLTNAKSTSNGMIDGDIYLVHSGDPSLTYTDLTDLMVALKSQQIQGINGNVYIDNTAYDQSNYGPGWKWDDTRYCYSAPINASIINHNCVSFRIAPAKTEGHYANVIGDPKFYYSGIENSVVTKSPWARSCYLRFDSDPNNTISISGCMPKGRYARGASVVISNIVEYNKSLFRSLFKRFGIQVNGNVGAGAAPANLATLATHESQPLHVLISKMLKMSDNVIAGSLFKKLGEEYYNEPGSWSNGSSAIKKILSQKAGVNTWQMTLVDGSGLSEGNEISPSQMMQVLDFAFHNYSTSYEFISALPIAGVDGTLKYRLKNVARRVRAKTGTMSKSGITSLAGYAINRNKEPIAFVIIVNEKSGNVWKYREMEDKIVTALVGYTG